MKKKAKALTERITKYPVIFTAVLFGVYILLYFVVENRIVTEPFLIETKLDPIIPFSKYAVVFYCAWHLEIAAIIVNYLFLRNREEYWRFVGKLALGLILILFICWIFPNEVNLRPAVVEGNDFFARLTRRIYAVDNSRTVFPSGHAYGAVVMMMGWIRIAKKPWQKVLALFLNSGIILSTLFLKQHSVMDIVAGILLAVAVEIISTYVQKNKERLFRHGRSESMKEDHF